MIKILTFCISVMFVLNIQADTTDSKWKNIIELKKTGDHCKDDANCFNRYHPAIEPRATANPGDIIVLHTSCLLYTSPSPRDISGSRMPSSA